ncbi:MAG TPA: IPT/TIG domain-containing protein [Candidatus Baltobacteraceae bacterium]|nr:IPT/TIG domain-containing protein [Candidatus Baltobacteraceae bacterium]
MPRGVHNSAFLITVFVVFLTGCGGGGGGGTQPPPLQPDFTIGLSATSVTIAQGSSSSPFNVSVNGANGFTGSVQVTLSGMPAGATSNPTSPFSVSTGQPVSVIVGAAPSAATGQFNISAQATSGSLSHSATLSLTIQSGVVLNLPRSTYLRNDSVAAIDIPSGEPRRRQIVYDSAGKRLFVANPAMNRVEVYAGGNPGLLAAIDAPGASSVDLSGDGATLWVGTSTEELLSISTSSLQVSTRYPMAGVSPIPGVVFDRPREAVVLAGGKLALRLRQSAASESLLALWDPASKIATDLTPRAPGVFQNGLGVMARSGDGTRLLAAANDSSGGAVVLDGNGNVVSGPQILGSGSVTSVAVNSNGSRFAAVINEGGGQQVALFDAALNSLRSYAATSAAGIVFSRDGQTLYVSEAFGNGRVITALSVSGLQKLGQVSDLAVQGIPTAIEEMDDSQLAWGRGNRGIGVIDVSSPAMLPLPAPVFASAPAALPAEGANAGGTSLTISGSNFPAGAQIRFGGQNPIAATLVGSSQIQVNSPASASSGPVNLTAYFSNGWVAAAPDGFSYGPSVQAILPNAASLAGGDTIYLIGHGFGASTGGITVKIGGQSATVQKVESLAAFAPALSLDSSYPFPVERITITSPSGTAGKVDILVTTPAGSVTLSKTFQYLAGSQSYANPSLYKFILYDQGRQQLYLSATDHVDVFDLAAQVFRSPLAPPPNGPPPDAGLRGMALTPDNTQLIVADFGAQNVYLINPDGGANNGSNVFVGGVAGYLNSGPSRVAATSAQSVFVGLSGEGGTSNACNSCLGQMNLTAFPPTFEPAPQPQVTSITGAPLMQADHNGDAVYLAFGSAPGGPVASWSAATPGSFTVSTAKDFSSDLTAAADGTMFGIRSNGTTEMRGADLTLAAVPTSAELETIPNRVAVPGVALHPSGALLYEPFLDGPAPAAPPATGIRGGVDIRDAHSGRLRMRLYLPGPFAMLSTDVDGLHGTFLTVDENGQRLFALTTSGVSVVQLSSLPLGIGSVAPGAGPAAGGTSVTIRGSGFQAGTKATLGGKAVTVTFKDKNTLTLATPALAAGTQQLVLTNPDGESASLDAAFIAQ